MAGAGPPWSHAWVLPAHGASCKHLAKGNPGAVVVEMVFDGGRVGVVSST